MLWTKRFKNCLVIPISSLLLALFWMELIHQFAGPLLPSLFAPPQAEAAVLSIDPTANGTTVQGTLSGCATSFDCVNDGARSPATPALPTTEYVQFSRNQLAHYQMADIASVANVTSITVYLWHLENSASYQFQVGLYDTDETTQFGTTQNLPIRTGSPGWDSVTISGLSLTQTQINNLRIRTTCTRPGSGNSTCRNYSMYAEVTYAETNTATVSAVGTQQNVVKNTNQYLGGSFAVVRNSGAANVTSVTVNETGSIDAANNLKNIKLFYEQDVTGPLDCAGETYGGGEPQFGSTISVGFSGTNGSATFTGSSVGISATAALCLYVVADVQSGATPGDAIEIQITNPSTDVVGDGGLTVSPGTAIAVAGASTVTAAVPSQSGYHWRNDDNTEPLASTAVGSENTLYTDFPKATPKRIRLQVSNIGNATASSIPYRLEYASKSGFASCADISSGWTDVGAATDHFDMFDSANLTDGSNTTDVVLNANGAITNPGGKTFQGTNAAQKDTSSQTAGITLSTTQYTELEYSIQSSASVSDGSTYCFRVTDAGTPLTSYVQYPEVVIAADINVVASGTHTATVVIPSADNYAGGVFAISDTGGGANTVTAIKLTEIGSITASSGISNIELRYDFDVTAPRTCDDQSYNIGDTPFGTASSFNDSSEITFTDNISIDTGKTLCVYIEYDVTTSASNGNVLEMQIANPSTDVMVTSSTVAPSSAVSPTGNTLVDGPLLTQIHYHWRNDDGSETTASSASGGSEDTPISDVRKGDTTRIRIAVSNEGGVTSPAVTYRLEYRAKITTCDAGGLWFDVGDVGGAWNMSPSINIADGNTTDITGFATGELTNENTTFVGTGALRESTSESAPLTLTSSQFTELEYSIEATVEAGYLSTYCFRVTDAGAELSSYVVYPEVTTVQRQDFFVQRGEEIVSGTGVTLVAGTDYDFIAATSSAFVRITNSQLSGAGDSGGTSPQNTDDVTAYISDQGDITTSFTIGRPAAAAAETRVFWEIIEFVGEPGTDNEMIVRGVGELPIAATNLTGSGATTGGVVDDTDVVVFITGQSSDASGRTFNESLYTASWNTSTNQPDFTRGDADSSSNVSYAVVEFTGINWLIQRVEHVYVDAIGTPETVGITPIPNVSKGFIHSQKRVGNGLAGLDEIGHQVWLSSLGQVSFQLRSGATTPTDHVSVAWVIANIQNGVGEMVVYNPFGTIAAGGTEVSAVSSTIGGTIRPANASIFATNDSTGTGTAFPPVYAGYSIASSTNFEIWRSDTGESIDFQALIVEWPVAETSVTQNYYRFYVDNDTLDPTDPWPLGAADLGENTSLTIDDEPLAEGERIRIRMSLKINNATLAAGVGSFKLQYGLMETTCSAIAAWSDIGGPGGAGAWRGFDATPIDGTELATSSPAAGTLNLSVSDVVGTYEEQNNTTVNPYKVDVGQDIEYDWLIQHNTAEQRSNYCFRMVNADGGELVYTNYPTLRTTGYTPVVANWRWYDDEVSETPATALGAENVSPSNIVNQNSIKLRLTAAEIENSTGTNVKFALQYSEYADFSDGGTFVASTTSCTASSTWCFADGGGVEGELIQSATLSDADSCTAGVGSGCGTHNEDATTPNTLTQPAGSNMEFEFTLKQPAARVNAVYYFRPYDTERSLPVAASSSLPNLVTEGARMDFSVNGLPTGTSTGGIVTDATTTATAINFDNIPLNTPVEAAQRITVDTNATDGYQVLKYTSQQLLNSYGDSIQSITSSNTTPTGWATACVGPAISCFGYHVTDAVLFGGSARFAPLDSYAAASVSPVEIMYNSFPVNDTEDIIYRLQVSELQPAGDYVADITYVAVPVF